MALEEGLLLGFVELVQDAGDGTGRTVEPLGDQKGVGRSDLGDGSSPVSRVGMPLYVAGPIEVGEDAADGGQAQTETLGQFADRERSVAKLLKLGGVAGAEGCLGRRRGQLEAPRNHGRAAVIPPPLAARC